MTKKHRVMISVDEEIKNELQNIKKEKFYDKSYAEMFRYLVKLGIEESKKGK